MTTKLSMDIVAWQEAAALAARAKARELELRNAVFGQAFPNAIVGTNNFDLGRGYVLKGVRKLNYTLSSANDSAATQEALDAIEKLGNEGSFLVDRLVKWKPELSVSEYKKLDPEHNSTHRKIKELIDNALTITDATPTLEVANPPGL